MAVQVNEIIIRATVSEGGDAQPPAQNGAPKKEGDGADKDAIIAECVEQVMDILKKEMKR
jgi:hypothetical protein